MPIAHILASAALNADGASASSPSEQTMNSHETITNSRPVLIDTDGGSDDAWALFLAIQAHKEESNPFKIEAITCVHGTTTVDQATINMTRVLQTADISDMHVYRGADSALVNCFQQDVSLYNGKDGFGDANLLPLSPQIQSGHAVNAIIELAKVHRGNLTVLALGPLTNLAMAVRLEPKIRDYFKEVYVLGGNVEGVGNATVCAEFNFNADAEAAHIVLSTFTCPINIIPWETCLKFATSSYSWRLNKLGGLNTAQMKLLNKIEARMLDRYQDSWLASDAVASAVLIEPRLVNRKVSYNCTVELQGLYSRGMMVVNRNCRLQKPSNVTIISEVDLPLYEKMLVWGAGGEHYKNH